MIASSSIETQFPCFAGSSRGESSIDAKASEGRSAPDGNASPKGAPKTARGRKSVLGRNRGDETARVFRQTQR